MSYYRQKVTSYEKFSHNLTFEAQIVYVVSAFLYYWWKYWNTEKLLNFKKFQLKWKIVKHFMRPKQQGPLRKLFSLHQPPIPSYKILLGLLNKIFLERYTEIYRYLLSKCFKKVVLGRQEMMQCKCFFWHQTETWWNINIILLTYLHVT